MILTTSNRSFIEAEQYSDFILQNLHDGLLPTNFYRDVSDFGEGEVLNIKTIGEAQIQEIEEDQAITYSPIETGNVEMRISDYVGDGWYVTDKFRQDSSQTDALLAVRGKEATRAIQEHFETRALQTLNDGQLASDPNEIDGFPHRMVGSGGTAPNSTMDLEDLIVARLTFNKNEVPMAGRVGIVDPIVEATFNIVFKITSGNGDLSANQVWQDITENGFARDHNFVINLYGFNIMTSNRLPAVADETVDGVQVVGGVANIFMCIADDHVKPLMAAWRQQPRVEGERNKDKQRDEFVQTARYGFGLQRQDSLIVVLTSATQYQ
jgi:hypothetical protein